MNKLKLNILLLAITILLCACSKKEDATDDMSEAIGVNAGNFDIVTTVVGSPTEEGTAATDTISIALSITDETYYNVKLPRGTEYVSDYSKYIYGENPNFTVTVLSNVSESNFSNTVGIDKAVTLTQNCVRTKEGTSGPQEAAVLLDDKVVIARCYDAPDVFATILTSFVDQSNQPYEVHGINYTENCEVLSSLTYSGSYSPSVVNKAEIGSTMLFKFDGGSMYATKQLKTYDNCKSTLLKKLNNVSGQAIEEHYEDSNFYYAKAGDLYVGIFRENYNTQFVAFGSGDESKCNILSLLNQCLE